MNALSLNRCLIDGSVSESELDALKEIERTDPELPILSPLAKAAYLMKVGRVLSREQVKQALSSVFLIAGEDSESLLEGESICTFVNEVVHHSFEVSVGENRSVALSWHSEGSITEMLGNSDVWCSLGSLLEAQNLLGLDSPKQLTQALSKNIVYEEPQCYPCDDDFIGVINYRLQAVGGLDVDELSLTDYDHDYEVFHPEKELELDDERRFRWTDLLSADQLLELGVDPDLLADRPDLWIGRDALLESYQSGRLEALTVDSLVVCLGAGSEWSPDGIVEDQWSNELAEDADVDEYPESQLPILAFTCRSYEEEFDEGFSGSVDLLNALIAQLRESP